MGETTWAASRSVLGWVNGEWPDTVEVRFAEWVRHQVLQMEDGVVAVYRGSNGEKLVVSDD